MTKLSSEESQAKPEIYVGMGHSFEKLSFSPDGCSVITASQSGFAKLWDGITGREVRTLGRVLGVGRAPFSLDGRFFARVGKNERVVDVVEVTTGREVQKLEGHPCSVRSGCFSPRHLVLATGCTFNAVILWDVATGRKIRTLRLWSNYYLFFSPDGQLLVGGDVGSSNPAGEVKVWDVLTGQEILVEEAHFMEPCGFSMDNHFLAIRSTVDKTVTLWDLEAGHEAYTLDSSQWVVFSPDGHVLLSSESQDTIKVREVATGREIHTIERVATGRMSRAFSISQDGRLLTTRGRDGRLRFWDVMSGQVAQTFEGHSGGIDCISFSPDGKVVASDSEDRTVRLWSSATGREIRKPVSNPDPVLSVMFGPDGSIVALASKSNTVRVWDVASSQLRQTIHARLFGETHMIAFSPDGRLLATCGGYHSKAIRLWDVTTDREVHRFEGSDKAHSVAFSPDGRVLASGHYYDPGWIEPSKPGQLPVRDERIPGEIIRLWDVATARELSIIKDKGFNVIGSLSFSPNGLLLASSGHGGSIKLWDVDKAQEICALSKDECWFDSVCFSPDGFILASAGRQTGWQQDGIAWSTSGAGTIVIWDVEEACEIHEFVCTSAVKCVAFSANGHILASGSDDIKLWHLATRRNIHTFCSGSVTSLAFDPDARLLASVAGDRTIKLWNVENGRLVLTIAAIGLGEDFIAWTPEGHFLSTPAAENYVSLRIGSRAEALGQYRELFYRPDIVMRKLRGELVNSDSLVPPPRFSDAKPPEKDRMPELALPPKTKIVVPEGDITVIQDTVLVVAEAEDEKYSITEIRLSVNGKLQSNPEPLSQVERGLVTQEWTARLTPGDNVLGAYAVSSAGVRSALAERTVTYREMKPDKTIKPSLWVLGIAVTRYANSEYNLRYPVSDTTRLVKCFQSRTGDLFDQVYVKLVLDEEVTRARITEVREEFLSRASTRDVVVISLAGHGVRDRRGNFYYLTYDADAERPYDKGYSWMDVEQHLLGDLAPQKVVMMVDTCYAGGVTGDDKRSRGSIEVQEQSECLRLADSLKEATGCYVVMASTSRERAMEETSWGGGAFTAAVLEALEGKAASHGVVMMWGLLNYVDQRVIELTQGAQHPVCKIPHKAGNFPIAVAGNV